MKLKLITLLLVLSSLFSTLPVYGTTYWARPNGTQDLSGSTTFCNSIRSTDTNHTSVSRTNVPSAFGTIASAAACAKVAGDIVNISGIDGIYDSHDRRHTLKMDDVTVVPSFGLASGTSESNRTIVQGVPEDPVPEIRPDGGDGFYGNCCTLAALRNYITFQRLNINGINTSTTTNGVSCMGPIGSHVTLQDMEIQNCAYGMGIESFTNYTVYACNLNTDLVVRRNHIHHTGSTSGPSDPHGTGRGSGYAIYSYAQNMVIEDNEMDHNTAEFLQIYDDVTTTGCNPLTPIIRNNYMHHLIPGHPPSFNAGRCGGAIALNGSDPFVYNNIIDARCQEDPFSTQITFSLGVSWGVGHCDPSSNGRGFVYNNIILGPGQAGTNGIDAGICVGGLVAGSEAKNNVIIGYGNILGGGGAGSVITATNRLDALLSTCFNVDFTLKTGTNPCVDNGTTISFFSTDRVGIARPQGSAWDIGPYELGVAARQFFVSPSGNNLNTCAQAQNPATAKLTPRAGAACLTQAGDKLTIKAGTYTGVEAHIYETLITVANGTPGNPTIIEGDGNFVGCAIAQNCVTKLRPGVNTQGNNLEDASWIVIRGIEFDGTNVAEQGGFRLGGTASNVVFEDVHVHHWKQDGFSAHGPANFTLDEPLTNNIRWTRVRSEFNGTHDANSGCSPTPCAANHGFYVNVTDSIIEDSIVNNNGPVPAVGGGYGIGIQIYDSRDIPPDNVKSNRNIIRRNKIFSNAISGIAMDGELNKVYDNEIYNNVQSGIDHGYGCPMGVQIYNNTITGNGGNGIAVGIFRVDTCGQTIDISNNIIVGNGTNVNLNPSGSGLWTNTGSNNAGPAGLSGGTVVISSVTSCTVSTSDFRLKSGTNPCIDAGKVSTLRPNVNGSATDIGSYESFLCLSGSITGNTITLSCSMNLNTPLQPSTGVSGFSVNNGRTITNINVGTSTIQFTISGAVCLNSETWTLTYTPGNVTDSAHIGYTTNQLLFGFGPMTLSNNCATNLYFVATTGDDNNSGTSVSTPFRTIQKCINVLIPGDTCTVADGVYTLAPGVGIHGSISSAVGGGTVSSPKTLKSTNKHGAKLDISNAAVSSNYGFYISQNNWVIDGFEIYGGSSTAANVGIFVQGGVNTTIRNTRIHNIATGVCSNVGEFVGIYFSETIGSGTIENNLIYSIGRLRNGESGCSTTATINDHGLYIDGVQGGLTIKNNVIYDTWRGYPLKIFSNTVNPTIGLNVWNNTLADNTPTIAPLTSPAGVVLVQNVQNLSFKNNVNGPSLGFITCASGLVTSGIVMENNSTSSPFLVVTPACPFGSWTLNSNFQTNINFVNAAGRDYRLASGSQPIDTGQTISSVITDFDGVSRPQGSAYDRGAYEFVSTIIPRYVIPGSGSTGCINGGTNYNPTTNTCGTGTNTVYTSINNGWTWLQANPIGNTLIIRGGTYAETIAITSASGATSYAQAATVKAYSDPTTGIYEQVILQPGNIGSTAIIGFNCSCGNYLIFDHLILDGTGGYDGTSSSGASEGISMGQATSSIFTNLIHHVRFIDMEIRFTKGNGIAGRGSNNDIIRMYLHHNGIGAQIAGYQNGANGIYWATGNNNSIINSVFDNNLCYGVRFYYSPSDGSANNNTIDRSTFTNNGAGKAVINGLTSTCGSSGGGTVLGNNGNTVKNSIFTNNNQAMSIGQGGAGSTSQFYYNNTAYNNFYGFYLANAGNTGIVLQNNLIAGNTSKNIELNNLSVGITYTTNACPVGECGASTIPITAITSCTVSTSDFTLKSGTNPCRNAGTIVSNIPFSENLPDIGAFESFICPSGTIAGNTITITCTAAVPPLRPSAPSGWTLNNGRTISSISTFGNTITIQMSGNACISSEIWTATYTPGTMTDSALIGNQYNQAAFPMGPISLTNNCAGAGDTIPPGPPTGVQIGRLTIYH